MRKLLSIFLSILTLSLLFLTAFTLTACKQKDDALSPLTVDGERIVNEAGETVFLRGTNAGGLFVIEEWMTGFIGCNDHKNTTLALAERFGEATAQDVWTQYRKNWWSDVDFQNCKDMGINAVRLPFTYMNVDFSATFDYMEAGKNYDFTPLDQFIEKAGKYGIYTILDLHGAYGSQNGQDHSGEVIDDKANVTFYENPLLQTLTVNLWKMLASHYRDNPNVAGYDILNEPAEKAGETTQKHWMVFNDIYQAIREEDQKHIVFFESCWSGKNLPQPSQYGWKNCVYSFHHYAGDRITFNQHATSFQNFMREIEACQFGVPLHMGEFTCYNDEEKWDWTLAFLNSSRWHWNTWTYKVNNGWDSAWGIYNTTYAQNENAEQFKINANVDDKSQILLKIQRVRTENYHKTTFPSGNTLFSCIQKHCKIQK